MNMKIKMPDLGTTVEEMKVVRWLVDEGQPVKRGEPLLEVETDKATVEVESFVTGTLKEICVQADQETFKGDVIAVIHVDDPNGN